MRSVVFSLIFLAYLTCANSLLFAQNDAIEKRLDFLKKTDNLTDWIYDRLDYVAENPQQRLPFLLETQSKTWRKAKTVKEHYAWLDLINSQGYYQLLEGKILESTNSYEIAYTYYQREKVINYEVIEYILKPLSNNYTRLGDYERALYLQLLAVKILSKNKDKPENIAAVYSNMAISYRSMSNIADAEKSIKTGLKLANKNSEVNIILNNILASILYDKKNYSAAAKLINDNIAKQKNINQENAYLLIASYTTAANIYKELKKQQVALNNYNKALGLLNKYYKGYRLRERANILTQLGGLKLAENKPKFAIAYFNQTLSTLKINTGKGIEVDKIYGDNMLVDVFKELSNAYLQLNKPKEAFQNIKLALLSADKIRNVFADDFTKERLQADLKIIAEKGIEINYNLYQKTKDKELLNEILNLAEQSKSRTLLDQINSNQLLTAANKKDSLFAKKQAFERAIIYNEKQEIEGKSIKNTTETAKLKYDLALIDKEIKKKYEQFNLDNYNKPINEVLTALPANQIIEYFFGKDAIYIIDIENNYVKNVIKLNNADSIKKLITSYVNTYFQHGPNAMMNAPKDFYLASNQLYQTILNGIKFNKNKPVIVVPDDELGYISFDGLITNDKYNPNIANWPYLIENNIITYAFSLKTLTAPKGKNYTKKFTGLFVTHQKNGLKPLKALVDEAKAIKNIIAGDFLFNDKVTSAKLNTAFEQNQVLHIGTHAYLSGKNKEPTLDLDKEKLFLFELSSKKYAPALVVLSACRTADGLLASGEGIISLARGFNAIGTPTTIAGLWNVNDVSAAVIIGNFYKHLFDNKTNGEALHLAKLHWLNVPQNNNSLYLPYYWDNLVLMGTSQKIELTKAINWWLILSTLTGFLVIVGIFIIWKKKKLNN